MFHIMSPKFNLREVAKHCALLEDHLSHPPKRCPDCIRKHFLTIEAFLEEAVTLDKSGEMTEMLQASAAYVRTLQALWLDDRDMNEIAQLLRQMRKKITGDVFDFRVSSLNGLNDLDDLSAICPHGVLRKVSSQVLEASSHKKSVALMKFLSQAASRMGSGVGKHVYVVGGAVRNFVIDRPIKDIDVVIDAIALGGSRDSEWFANNLARLIPAQTNVTTNQYGVAIVTVKGSWVVDEEDLQGEVIEIANARKESYGGASGKGYKPDQVEKATIQDDVSRREFTFNTLMWRLSELANGPDQAEIVDLTGCGLKDLNDGLMKCPSDPNKTFSDDPTRMLRAIKFMVKYGFKIHPLVAAAIKRNASKLRNAPQNAISTILIDTILGEPTYKKALVEMKKLGLLDQVADMIRQDKGFRSTMENWVSNKKVLFLFDLIDVGLPLSARTGFLSPSQQQRLRTIALGMPEGKPEILLDALRQPGKAVKDKSFFPGLAREKGLKGKQIGAFMGKVQEVAREVMLENPRLVENPNALKREIEIQIRASKLSSRIAARYLSAGRTFTYYGYEYPNDGPHAKLMAEYMGPPDDKYSEAKWKLYRDWAKKRRIRKDDMQALLEAFDNGAANMILRGPARNSKDLDEIAQRLRIKVGTKSHTQKEDEAVEKLVKRLPKKKPPRNDLRKERVDSEKDEDIESLGQEGDRDLSRNYKRVAVRWLMSGEPAVDEGEESGGSGGGVSGLWVKFLEDVGDDKVTNPDTGRQNALKSLGKGPKGKKLQQKMFEKWKEDQEEDGEGGSEKGEDSSDEPKVVKMIPPEQQERRKEFAEKLDHFNENLPALGEMFAGFEDPVTMLDSFPAKDPKDKDTDLGALSQSIMSSASDMSASEVQTAYDNVNDLLDKAAKHNQDPDGRTSELQDSLSAAKQALAINMISRTGKHPDGDDLLDANQAAFISSVAEMDGGMEFLSKPSEQWNYPEHRDLVSKAILSMDYDAQLAAMGGPDSSGGMILEASAMWEGEDPEYAAMLASLAVDFHLDDNIVIPAAKKESEANKAKRPENAKDEDAPESGLPTQGGGMGIGTDQLKQLREAYEKGGEEGFREAANEVRKANLDSPLFSVDDGKFPGPATANIGAFAETGDPADLTSKTDPPIKSLFS